jgi:GTP-binding protein
MPVEQPKPRAQAENRAAAPTIVIVGRPNVGKSTLFNRLIGRRRAIVGDEPGITRDRIYGDAEWNGRNLRIIDTGGIIPEDKDLIPSEIFRQARVAFEEANAIVMVVDGRTEIAGPDLELARLLRKAGKPLFLAVNKIDARKLEANVENFHSLGIRDMFGISAESGDGVAELLEAILPVLPPVPEPGTAEMIGVADPAEEYASAEETDEEEHARRQAEREAREAQRETKIAIIGRPNVGKSTLLNALTGSGRAIVSPIAGTTRDAVDEVVEHGDKSYRFIDTAGIRRKGKTELMAEKLSVVMARKHLEAADIALIVIDATEGVTASDATIAGYAHEAGRSVIILINKWDLVTANEPKYKRIPRGSQQASKPADRGIFEEQARIALKFLNYAPMLFISAEKGTGIQKIWPEIELVARERRKRIPTGEMNRFLEHVDFERASVPVSKRVRILYLTQAAVAPPTFILFTDRDVKLHFAYQRFLENTIRKAFGFVGTPIWIKVRARNPKRKE